MSEPDTTLVTATWVAPMSRPVIRDGGVVFAGGRMVKTGPSKLLRLAHPDARVLDLGASILMPGLVNAHTHLELSHHEAREPAASFRDWVSRLRARASADSDRSTVARALRDGASQSLRFGVTTVGDITNYPSLARSLLSGIIRMTSFGEIRAMARRREQLEPALAAALSTDPPDGSWLRRGVSPHAPYSVEPYGYAHSLRAAVTQRLPIQTHLAESADEGDFLARHEGPLRDLWESIGGWDKDVPTFEGGPIRFTRSLGLLDYPRASLAHVNHCDDDELSILASGQASIVYCPRTHRYFGHPPHRWREMIAAGLNVAVGTDSCASSKNLNVVDDLRLLHELAPDFPVEQLWGLATHNAADAIDMPVGRLEPGLPADFVAFRAHGDEPLKDILENDASPCGVWIAGTPVKSSTPASPG